MTNRPATVEASLRLSSEQRYAICVGNFYADLAERLVKGATDVFAEAGIGSGDIDIFEVPGAFELPLAAHYCAASGRYAGVACLGAVIRGETDHYDFVCSEAAPWHPERPARNRDPLRIRRADGGEHGSGAGPHRRRKAGLGRECGGRLAPHE